MTNTNTLLFRRGYDDGILGICIKSNLPPYYKEEYDRGYEAGSLWRLQHEERKVDRVRKGEELKRAFTRAKQALLAAGSLATDAVFWFLHGFLILLLWLVLASVVFTIGRLLLVQESSPVAIGVLCFIVLCGTVGYIFRDKKDYDKGVK